MGRSDGDRQPRADELAKLAAALGTTTDYLLNGESEPAQNEPPKNQGNNLHINNASPETSSDDLDLGFWGNVAAKASKVAKSNDPRKPLVAALLNSAMNEFADSDAAPIITKNSIIGVQGDIQGGQNVNVGTS